MLVLQAPRPVKAPTAPPVLPLDLSQTSTSGLLPMVLSDLSGPLSVPTAGVEDWIRTQTTAPIERSRMRIAPVQPYDSVRWLKIARMKKSHL